MTHCVFGITMRIVQNYNANRPVRIVQGTMRIVFDANRPDTI